MNGYPFESPRDTTDTAPRSNAARVVGDVARCWANYFGCYGIEPTHVFLGEKEWAELRDWFKTSPEVFQGMKVYKTDRPGITCAVCFHEPQKDADPPARRPVETPMNMAKDPSSQDT
jgi:hypothetical protein